jgi:16S rRNA (cytidine1402-2'-O)-methyltransferase
MATGTLYLVATPIGNLGDWTDRARSVVAAVDVVAAEDTRRTGRLLDSAGVKARRLVSFFEGNEGSRTRELLDELRAGRDVAVVTDGGMPAVSDPGVPLVRACIEEDIRVTVVPGPSAVLAALVVSGLPTDRFTFEGFVPRKAGERRARFSAMHDDPRTAVFFESPHRVEAALSDLVAALGDRQVALCRELTKLHEEMIRGTTTEVLEEVRRRGGELKGEVVLVVAGASERATPPLDVLADEAAALVRAGARKRDAAAEVAAKHGAKANDIYRALISSD